MRECTKRHQAERDKNEVGKRAARYDLPLCGVCHSHDIAFKCLDQTKEAENAIFKTGKSGLSGN